MADVVFEDENQMRRSKRRSEGSGGASESAIVNFLLEKGIARSKPQANAYVLILLALIILASLYFSDQAGITQTGIGNIGEPESAPRMSPMDYEVFYGS